MFETRKGGREAWSSENKRGERKGMCLRGEGGDQLQAALWEIWGITGGFGAGSVMERFYQDLSSCPVGNGLRRPG